MSGAQQKMSTFNQNYLKVCTPSLSAQMSPSTPAKILRKCKLNDKN